MLTSDLIVLAERPGEEVETILKALADARLLRRIESSDRYEIFHDAFAAALLDWRKDYLLECARRDAAQAAERRQQEEMKEAARRRRQQLALAGGALVVIGVGAYIFHGWQDRRELSKRNGELQISVQLAQADGRQSALRAAVSEAAQREAELKLRAQRDQLDAERLKLESDRARLNGDVERARALEAQAQVKQATAAQAQKDSIKVAEQSRASQDALNATQATIDRLNKEAQDNGYKIAKPIEAVNAPPVAPKPTTGDVSLTAADAAGNPLAGVTVSLTGAQTTTSVSDARGVARVPNLAPGAYKVAASLSGFNTYSGDVRVEAGTTTDVKVVLAPPVLTGSYKDSYKKAIDAINGKHWTDAQAWLETALRQNPKETGETIRISGFGNVEPYVPHYYLGVVLRNLDDCTGALAQFDLSEKDGAVQKTNLYKSLLQQRKNCTK